MALTFNPPRIPNGNGDALWKGTDQSKFNQCDCCPYGYHIDLDFVRFCETVSNRNDASLVKERRRERRRQRQSMEVLLGLTSQTFWNLEQQLPKIPQEPVVIADPPDSSTTSELVRDALHRAVQDFEDTLERTNKTQGNIQPEHLQDGFADVPREAASSGDTSLSSMSAVSSPLTSQEVDNEAAMSSAAHEALLQDFDVASIGSATSGHSHAALQNIRQQMALSLERMRDLEEQVKLIPILQVQLSVAKEEKRKISLFMQANKLEQSKKTDDESFILVPYDDQSNQTIGNHAVKKNSSKPKQKHVSTNTEQSLKPQTTQDLNGEPQNILPSASWLEFRQMEILTDNHRKGLLTSSPSEVMFKECDEMISLPAADKIKRTQGDWSSNVVAHAKDKVALIKTLDCNPPHLVKGSTSLCSGSIYPQQVTTCLQVEQKVQPNVSTECGTTANKKHHNGSLTRTGRKLHRTSSPRRRSRSASEDRFSTEPIMLCAPEPFPIQAPSRRQKPVRNVETQTVSKFATRDVGLGTSHAKEELQSLKDSSSIFAKEGINTNTTNSTFLNSSKGAKKAFAEYFKHMYSNELPTNMDTQAHMDCFLKYLNTFLCDNQRSEESIGKKSIGTQVSTHAKSVALQTSSSIVHRSDAMVQVLPKVRHVQTSATVDQKTVGTGIGDVNGKDLSCHNCTSNITTVPSAPLDIIDNSCGEFTPTPTGIKKPHCKISVHVQTSEDIYTPTNNHKECNTNSWTGSRGTNQFSNNDDKKSDCKFALIKYNSDFVDTPESSGQECESKIPRPKSFKTLTRQHTYTKIDHPKDIQSQDLSLPTFDASRLLWTSSSDFTDQCSEEWSTTSSVKQAKDVAKGDTFQEECNVPVEDNSSSKDRSSLSDGSSKTRSSIRTDSKCTAEERSNSYKSTPGPSASVIDLKKVLSTPSSPFSVVAPSKNVVNPEKERQIIDPTIVKPNPHNISYIRVIPAKSKPNNSQPTSQLTPSLLTTDLNTADSNSQESTSRGSRVVSLEKNQTKSLPSVNARAGELNSEFSNVLVEKHSESTNTSCNVDHPSTSSTDRPTKHCTNFVQPEGANGELSPLHPLRDDLLQLDSSERTTRVVPSRTMKAALKVVNDALLKSSSSGSASSGAREIASPSTGSALDIIRREWFIISSTREADPNIVEDYLDYFEEMSAGLLKYVVNMIDKAGNTAMHYALSTGNFDVVSILLDSKVCDINLPNSAGYTAVMLLSLAKIRSETDRRVLQRFLAYADVNIRAALNGQTALMLAVSQNRLDMVQLLVEGGADLNIQDIDGSTALMCAAEHGLVNMVQYLINQPDADQTIKDLDGSTALDIALDAGHKDVGILLYAHKHFSRNNSPYSSLRGRRSKSATPKPATPTGAASASTPPPRTTPSSPLPSRVRRTQQ